MGQRWCDLPGRDGEREIPGRDDAYHAERLPGHLNGHAGPDRGHLLARQPHDLPGEELEDIARTGRLADALGQDLALLAGQERTQLGLTLENGVTDPIEAV